MGKSMQFRKNALACVLAAIACVGLFGFKPVQAAPEIDQSSQAKKRTKLLDTLIPIPSWSRDVAANGCPLHTSPGQSSGDTSVSLTQIPFWALVSHASGRYTVKMTVRGPAKFLEEIASLDDDMRRLVLLYALWDRFGRDGLHTFFYMKGGAVAPSIRDALREAGMVREHEIFTRAMALFGETYPIDEAVREKAFGYSTARQELNDFDHNLLALGKEFGTKETYAAAVIGYVNRSPALWQRIEALREKLGDPERLELLMNALGDKVDLWQPPAEIDRQLSALSKKHRTLLVAATFNSEFENGGVHQFFYNSAGAIAPEVHAVLIELGLDRQAALLQRGIAMFGESYIRDTQQRRDVHFHNHDDWNEWDKRLSALTDEFYALEGGPVVYRLGGDLTIDGGPNVRHAMLGFARRNDLLPC
jgi:hypothetical protein